LSAVALLFATANAFTGSANVAIAVARDIEKWIKEQEIE